MLIASHSLRIHMDCGKESLMMSCSLLSAPLGLLGSAVARWSLTCELPLSCARPTADG